MVESFDKYESTLNEKKHNEKEVLSADRLAQTLYELL